jgi:hypothetical protein
MVNAPEDFTVGERVRYLNRGDAQLGVYREAVVVEIGRLVTVRIAGGHLMGIPATELEKLP